MESKSNTGGGGAPPSPKRSNRGTPSVEGTMAGAAAVVPASSSKPVAIEDPTQAIIQPERQDKNEHDRDGDDSSICSGKSKANDEMNVPIEAGSSIVGDCKSGEGLHGTATDKNRTGTHSESSTTVGETATSRGPSDMQGRAANAAVTTNRADQSDLPSSTTGQQLQNQDDATPTLGRSTGSACTSTSSTRKEREESSASAAGVDVKTKPAAIPAATESTKIAAATACATSTIGSKAQQQRQNSDLVGNRPPPPVRRLPDPETVRLTNNILHLLQIYGPLTAELLEYNLPPLATSRQISKGGRTKAAGGGGSMYVHDRLRQVLDLLVALGVIGIAAAPNDSERIPPSFSGISSMKPPTKVHTGAAATAQGEDQSGSAVAAARKVDADADGANVPAVGSNRQLPPASAQSSSSTNSERKNLLPETSPVSSLQGRESEAIGKEAAAIVNGVPKYTSLNLPTGPKVQDSHQVLLPQCQQRHQQDASREKSVASPIRYVYLDGRPRADVVFPCQLPALIQSAEREVQGAVRRAKRLREELSVAAPNSKRSGTARKSVEEVLLSLLKEFPEIVYDPVYFAALRSNGIDTRTRCSTAISEPGQTKARFVGKTLKNEEGKNVEEIEELALAAGATPSVSPVVP